MNFPVLKVEFDMDGNIFERARTEEELAGFPKPTETDLFVISHGWNNDTEEAKELYESLFASMEKAIAQNKVPGAAGKKFAVLEVFWPSKKFAEEQYIPGGGAASATEASEDAAILRLINDLKEDEVRLGVKKPDPLASAVLEKIKLLVPKLTNDPQARKEFVFHLRSILSPGDAHAEDGSDDFFLANPEDLFQNLKKPVTAPPPVAGTGGAAGMGGAAGFFGDLADSIKSAARRLLNFTTYFKMKERAGTVGRVGLAQVLRMIRRRRPDLKIHLIGHSFGGRLVTAAVHALEDDTTVNSLTLLQAAFSHNGLAQNFDERGHDGAFRSLITRKRVTGPISITHTKNDLAVGAAYPLASRISQDVAAALGDENDPYGGMGRNGAQHTPEAVGLKFSLDAGVETWNLRAGKVHNFKADRSIKDHSDITGESVACLLLAVAARS